MTLKLSLSASRVVILKFLRKMKAFSKYRDKFKSLVGPEAEFLIAEDNDIIGERNPTKLKRI